MTVTTPATLFFFCKFSLLSKPGDEQCRYMCQSEGENFMVSRGSQFADGTRCESDSPPPFGSTAACLRGKCQVAMTKQNMLESRCSFTLSYLLKKKCLCSLFVSDQLFGCDGVLHSGKVWDECGVCGGNGSSCTLTSDSYTAGQARGNSSVSLPNTLSHRKWPDLNHWKQHCVYLI